MFERLAASLTSAAIGLIKLVLVVCLLVATIHWANNNPKQFGMVVGSVGTAAANVIQRTAGYVSEKTAP